MGDISSRNCPFIVRACNEYETLKAQLQVTNATVDHYEQRQLELIKEAGDAKAHAQRLADALRNALNMIDPDVWDKSKESGVLAQWEQDKQ